MRKYIRKLLKERAIKIKTKPSKYVRNHWNTIMIKKYGIAFRDRNISRGTHKESLWLSREFLFHDNTVRKLKEK